jgi:hypothetical protein
MEIRVALRFKIESSYPDSAFGYVPPPSTLKTKSSSVSKSYLYAHPPNSIVHDSRKKQHGWLSKEEWIKKMWCRHRTEYYSDLRTKGILTQAATWTNVEDTVLRESIHSQRDKRCTISIIGGT